MLKVPPANAPSHESLPEYDAAMLLLVTPDAVASMITLQIGVGTLPPVGKTILRVSVVPESVADSDPSLTL